MPGILPSLVRTDILKHLFESRLVEEKIAREVSKEADSRRAVQARFERGARR
jgi:hypothetical protein